MSSINNRKDILLLLLYSPGIYYNENEPIEGRTRLSKMIFLFKKEFFKTFKNGTEITEEDFYKFQPWNYGPFSFQVYDDLNFFILRDFIKSSLLDINSENDDIKNSEPESAAESMRYYTALGFNKENEDEYREEEFTLTDKGLKFTKKLYEELTDEQKEVLKRFKLNLLSLSLKDILRYVYKTYPDQIEKSKIKEEILSD